MDHGFMPLADGWCGPSSGLPPERFRELWRHPNPANGRAAEMYNQESPLTTALCTWTDTLPPTGGGTDRRRTGDNKKKTEE
jgi:hypothetical protein